MSTTTDGTPYQLATNPIFRKIADGLEAQTDPERITVVTGYVGRITDTQVQVFPTLRLNSYFHINVDDVLYAEPVDASSPSSPVRLFVDSNAGLTFVNKTTLVVPAKSYHPLHTRGAAAAHGPHGSHTPQAAAPSANGAARNAASGLGFDGPITGPNPVCPCGRFDSDGRCSCIMPLFPFPLLDIRLAKELGIEIV